jgi:hypothetical protein
MSDPKYSSEDEAEIVREDIAQARAELAQTVDALSEKLDVKQQAADKVNEAKQKVVETAQHAKESAPEPVQRALDSVGAKAGPTAHRVAEQAAPHRGKIIAGLAVTAVVLMILRRKRAD